MMHPSTQPSIGWYPTLTRIGEMLASPDEETLKARWVRLAADQSIAAPPYHVSRIVTELEAYRGNRPQSEIRILDHGCGPGSTLIWLASVGYTNINGVDVGGDLGAQNRWARVALGHAEPRFAVFGGSHLPFANASIDVVLSQQVLEHVAQPHFVEYYREEGRVLVDGGLAIHQVPHRLVPYDSHSRTWLLHMLPEARARQLMPLFGREWPDHLHLRWPSEHTQMLGREIGPCINHTVERLVKLKEMDHYDGPRGLRDALGGVCRTPVVGTMLARVLANFMLMETTAVRRR